MADTNAYGYYPVSDEQLSGLQRQLSQARLGGQTVMPYEYEQALQALLSAQAGQETSRYQTHLQNVLATNAQNIQQGEFAANLRQQKNAANAAGTGNLISAALKAPVAGLEGYKLYQKMFGGTPATDDNLAGGAIDQTPEDPTAMYDIQGGTRLSNAAFTQEGGGLPSMTPAPAVTATGSTEPAAVDTTTGLQDLATTPAAGPSDVWDLSTILPGAAVDTGAAVTDTSADLASDLAGGGTDEGISLATGEGEEQGADLLSAFGNCVIVTACHGRYSPEVEITRQYRNRFMNQTQLRGYYMLASRVVPQMKNKKSVMEWVTNHLVKHLIEYADWVLNGPRPSKPPLKAKIVSKLFLLLCRLIGSTRKSYRRINGEVY